MLDDLLGKTTLKERIEELQDEVESLEDRLAAEQRRRKDAVTEKQEADRRVNELEDKVQELRDRLERAEDKDNDQRRFRVARAVRGDELDGIIELLASARSGDEALTTVTVAPDDPVPDEFEAETTELLRRIDTSMGLVVFGDDAGVVRSVLVPPLEVDETGVEHADEFVFDRSLFEIPRPFAVAVVRSDEYAGGVYDGGRLEFSSLSSDIMSKHSKGGFSQSRFERGRDEQVEEHVHEAVDRFEETVAEHDPEVVFVAGDARVVSRFVDAVDVDAPIAQRTADATGSGEQLLRLGYDSVRSARLYVV